MLYYIQKLFFFFILYSVLGWIYETALCSLREKRFVNRGFLNGPYCPIYGAGSIMFLLILGREKSPLLIFIFGAIIACALEYATSYVMERLFKARWWDYSDFKYNLNGRICLGAATVFGAFAAFLIKALHPLVISWTDMIYPPVFGALCIALLITFTLDTVISVVGITGLDKKLTAVSDKSAGKLQTNTPSHTYTVSEKLSRQQIRLLKAFPKMRSINHTEAIERLRSSFNKPRKADKHK